MTDTRAEEAPLPRHRPPFRAEHIGPLLRPSAQPSLPLPAPATPAAQGDAAEREQAVREVLQLQAEAGLKVVTDGAQWHRAPWAGFVGRCSGLQHGAGEASLQISAPLRRLHPIAVDSFAFVRSNSALRAKATLPAPSTLHWCSGRPRTVAGVYDCEEALLDDLAAVYRQEIAALYAAGCRYVQLDEQAIGLLCDPARRERAGIASGDVDHLVGLYVDAINQCVAGRPEDLLVGLHLDRIVTRNAHGARSDALERVLAEAQVSHFLIDCDGAGAQTFAALRAIPHGRSAVLGIVSARDPRLETVGELRERVDAAGRWLPLDRLALCPSAGFDAEALRIDPSPAGGAPSIRPADQRAKLARLVEAAHLIWHE